MCREICVQKPPMYRRKKNINVQEEKYRQCIRRKDNIDEDNINVQKKQYINVQEKEQQKNGINVQEEE